MDNYQKALEHIAMLVQLHMRCLRLPMLSRMWVRCT